MTKGFIPKYDDKRLKRREGLFAEIKLLDDGIGNNPNNDELITERGIAYANLGLYSKSMKDLDKALEINPDNELALHQKGDLYMDQKEYENAIKCFDRIINLNPEKVYIKFFRAEALKYLEKFDEAKEIFRGIIKESSKGDEIRAGLRQIYLCEKEKKDYKDLTNLEWDEMDPWLSKQIVENVVT